MDRFVPPSFGWRPDMPDFRDFTPDNPSVGEMLRSSGMPRTGRSGRRKPRVDLREYFSEPLDQGLLASSCAHACAALVEYFESPVERPCDPAIEAISTRECAPDGDGTARQCRELAVHPESDCCLWIAAGTALALRTLHG